MARLRRADCSGPGFRRVRRGRGFTYLDEDGEPIDEPEVRRAARAGSASRRPGRTSGSARGPNGHIQATGVDAAGRKQYLYHPDWRTRRDAEKFDEMLDFAKALPGAARARRRGLGGVRRARPASACSPAPCGCSTAASSGSAPRSTRSHNESLRPGDDAQGARDARGRRHDGLRLPRQERQAPGAGGRRPGGDRGRRRRSSAAAAAATSCSPTSRAAAGATCAPTTSTSTSRSVTGGDYSAKDFRTWNATVLAAVGLAVSGEVAGTKTGRKRAITPRGQGGRALPRQHARRLPRLLHRPAGLRRLRGRPDHPPGARGGRRGGRAASWRSTSPALERAVLDLIDERASAPGIEQLAA